MIRPLKTEYFPPGLPPEAISCGEWATLQLLTTVHRNSVPWLSVYPCEEETCRRSLLCPSFSTVSRQSSNHGKSSLLALHSQREHRSWSSPWFLASTHAMDLSTGSGGITHPDSNLALCHCMDCGPHQSPGQQHRTRTSPSPQVAAQATYINMAPGNSIANRHQNLGLVLFLSVATRNFQVTQMTPICSLHNISVG